MFSFLLWLNLIFHHFQFNDQITEFVHNIKFDRFSVRCWGHNYIVCMQKKIFQAVLILGSECWNHQLMRWNHLIEDGVLSFQSVNLQMISCYRMQSNQMWNILCLFAFFSNKKILIFKKKLTFDFIFNTWFDWISCLNGMMHSNTFLLHFYVSPEIVLLTGIFHLRKIVEKYLKLIMI